MAGMLFGIFTLIFWPIYDIRRTKQIKGIGYQEEAKLDEATVERWKKGRIRAKMLWIGFGIFILMSIALNFSMEIYLPRGEDGVYQDTELAGLLLSLVNILLNIGIVGFIGGLVYSGWNNKRNLGQIYVKVR